MAKEIRQWKADDGKLFDTQEKAEKYECEQEEIERLMQLIKDDPESAGKFDLLGVSKFIIGHKRELLDILYLKGQYIDIAFTRENLLKTAGLSVEKSKNGKSKKSGKAGPELKIKKPVESSSSKSRQPVKLVKPEKLIGK